MSSDVPTESVFSLVTLTFESKWILVKDVLNQILLSLLVFIALQILRKVSVCCARLLFGVWYYVNVQFTSRMGIDGSHYCEQNLSWMSTNNIHLLQIKIQGHLQKEAFECLFNAYYVLFKSPFCFFFFSASNSLTNLPS